MAALGPLEQNYILRTRDLFYTFALNEIIAQSGLSFSVATFALALCPMSVPIIIDDQYCIVGETLTSLTIDAHPSRIFYDPHGIALAA